MGRNRSHPGLGHERRKIEERNLLVETRKYVIEASQPRQHGLEHSCNNTPTDRGTSQTESVGSDCLPWLLIVKIEHDIEQNKSHDTRRIFVDKEAREVYQQTMWEGFCNLNEQIITEENCEIYVETMEKFITAALDEYAPLRTTTRREHLPPEINKKIDYKNNLKQINWQVRYCSPNLQREVYTFYNKAKKEADQALKEYTKKGWLDKIQDPNDKRS
ncbi:hypothetical protein EVAR_89604_1 [Eumeta japonica]|uniref:Uncharacterized protein n=1 Tax=Eumeta variegata TaxID=151549 RepID=A0A4C1XM59_EUMVA|nr:hypothetical protein EVAR_89604_1 [Eumeta japonica]